MSGNRPPLRHTCVLCGSLRSGRIAGRSPNIQVSEVKYITAEAVRSGAAEIALKGKIRTILLPNRLCRKLQKYARQQKIASGEIFITQSGTGMDRKQIWAEMKKLCRLAGVERGKVYPHNLRSLFARSFYSACHDVGGWRMCWATAVSRRPGFISCPREKSTSDSWTN